MAALRKHFFNRSSQAVPKRSTSGFEKRLGEARLTDDAQQRSASERIVERDRNGNGTRKRGLPQHSVAASLAGSGEALGFKNLADFLAGQDAQSTQPEPRR